MWEDWQRIGVSSAVGCLCVCMLVFEVDAYLCELLSYFEKLFPALLNPPLTSEKPIGK